MPLEPLHVLACVLVAGLLVLAAWTSGGYFPTDVALIGVVALVGLALLVLVLPRVAVPSGPGLLTLTGIVALAAWSGLSAAWSPDPVAATQAMIRAGAYAAVFALALLAAGTGRHAALLVRLVVLVLVAICVAAVLSRLRPFLIPTDPGLVSFAGGRLSYPISYWNGLGAIAAMAIVATAALACDPQGRRVERALAAAGGTVATLALYLTLSRASIAAALLGLLVLAVLSPRRVRLLGSAAIIGAAGAVAVLVVRGSPELVDMPGALDVQSREGGRALAVLVALAAGAAAVQWVVAALEPGTRPTGSRSRGRHVPVGAQRVPVVGIVAGLVLALVGAAGYAAAGERLEGRVADGVFGARSFVDRQYDEFLDSSAAPARGQERLSESRSSRSESFRVARETFADAPLVGVGAGGYRVAWFERREITESIRNAHSLPLETLAELGLVGGAILAMILAGLLSGLRSVRVRTRGLTRAQAAAGGGAVTVWVVHAALDWDWQLAGVTLPALVLAAALHSSLPGGRGGGEGSRGRGRGAAATS
ncbi:hypothetical protein GKE82_01835 [Conexibacter sp. W3-3-2]|uniref:O-antigen ligase family protein n=1 Tax=Solirubrobacterales TaxID=588673 RepID=UPI000D1F01D2|nr:MULTISPECIES: O-antigen ligase family protein [Solirubrobacterales]MTD43077.1 hypothetical protein [Conexibacter sp. W3-3-2]